MAQPNTAVELKNMDPVPSLINCIKRGDTYALRQKIADLRKNGQGHLLGNMCAEDETILHRAVKMRADRSVLSVLLDLCPELLADSRQDSELYRGQTALHIAVTGNDVDVVELLLQKAKLCGDVTFSSIINGCATGTRFENTVMLGEFPLAVAALTLNTNMFDKILEFGAKLNSQNSKGDSIFHALVIYAYLYPDKLIDIVKMFEHVSNIANVTEGETPERNVNGTSVNPKQTMPTKSNVSTWMLRSNENLNPLTLAAKLGQHVLFKLIMEMRDVYCYVNSEDGLFDVKMYDVTDIDSLSDYSLLQCLLAEVFDDDNKDSKKMDLKPDKVNVTCNVPTLEMIIDNDPVTVFKFIEMSPLRYVINRKWAFYRWIFAIWGLLHIAFMIGYTVYAVRRSDVRRNASIPETTLEFKNKIGSDGYVTCYAVLSLIFALIYLAQEIIRIYKGRMPWTLSHIHNSYHTGPFRLLLVLFGVTIIVDVIWRLATNHYEDYVMVVSMILGWWFLVYFLRGIRQFSFFTVMIQKVLVGDMFRFSIIITMELVAFTTGMFIAFRGTHTSDENVGEYGKFLVLSFKMMFGLTSLDVLFEAPSPWFAVFLYVGFVLFTFVLMINSLIAMMSNTCSVVSQNRDIQHRVQQLSIILFFESIFPKRWLRIVGEKRISNMFDPTTNNTVQKTRLFMEVRSLHEVTNSKSRHHPNTETMLETIFHTIKNIQLPHLNVFETENPVTDVANNAVVVERRTPLRRAPTHSNDRSGIENVSAENDADDVTSFKKRKPKKKKKQRVEDDGTVTTAITDADNTVSGAQPYTFPKDREPLTVVEDI